MSIAATVIILSFGIIILFISVEIIEDKTSTKIELQEIPNLIGNANEIVIDTRNATKYELIQFFNRTADAIQNSTQLQSFQQLWETP
jgi:predicted sulfurtransferase